MRTEPRHVRNVADMVAHAVAVVISPSDLPCGHRLDHLKALQDRRVALPSTAEVIHLPNPGCSHEGFEGAHHINTMDLIADLFPLVAKNRECLAARGGFDEKLRKPCSSTPLWLGP